MKISLLKANRFLDFLQSERNSFWGNDPFIFTVIQSVNDGDFSPGKFLHGFIDTQNISVLFFSVRSNHTLDIPVIYRVTHILVLWMVASKRSVNGYFYDVTSHKITSIGSNSLA